MLFLEYRNLHHHNETQDHSLTARRMVLGSWMMVFGAIEHLNRRRSQPAGLAQKEPKRAAESCIPAITQEFSAPLLCIPRPRTRQKSFSTMQLRTYDPHHRHDPTLILRQSLDQTSSSPQRASLPTHHHAQQCKRHEASKATDRPASTLHGPVEHPPAPLNPIPHNSASTPSPMPWSPPPSLPRALLPPRNPTSPPFPPLPVATASRCSITTIIRAAKRHYRGLRARQKECGTRCASL